MNKITLFDAALLVKVNTMQIDYVERSVKSLWPLSLKRDITILEEWWFCHILF